MNRLAKASRFPIGQSPYVNSGLTEPNIKVPNTASKQAPAIDTTTSSTALAPIPSLKTVTSTSIRFILIYPVNT